MRSLEIHSEAYRCDPYAYFEWFRQHQPIAPIAPYGHWAVFCYQDVETILTRDDLFSSEIKTEQSDSSAQQALLFDRSLIGMDNPEHHRLRKWVAKAFRPRLISAMAASVQSTCQSLVNEINPGQAIDFVENFSAPLPIIVIASILGMDDLNLPQLKAWVNLLLSWNQPDKATSLAAEVEGMYRYFRLLIEEKKKRPANDLISFLLAESGLTENSMIALTRLLLVAATDTTTSLLNNSLLVLSKFPEIYLVIQHDRSKIDDFIDETLRYDSPTISLMRRATRDLTLAGQAIQQDELLLPILASANHDESLYANPRQFNLYRGQRKHLGFGGGVHHCLGSHLAKLQVKTSLNLLLDKFSEVRLKEDSALTYLPTFFFRSLSRLELVFG